MLGGTLLAQGAPQDRTPQPIQALAQYLNLTQEQVDAWMVLLEDLRTATLPLHQAIQDKSAELQALLESESPDPAAVGALVLEIQQLKEEIRLLEEAYRDGFVALLTPEQLGKFNELLQAERLQRILPALKALKLF